jgi:hypothetical protein
MNIGEDYIDKFNKRYFSFVQPKNFDLYLALLETHYGSLVFNDFQLETIEKFSDNNDVYLDNCERRCGISTVLEMTAIVHALTKDYQTILFYGVNQRSFERTYNSIRRYLVDLKLLNHMIFNHKHLTLINGSKIFFMHNGEPTRGFNPDLIVVDDAMVDCINGIYPIKNAKLIVNSASANKFKQIKDSLN